MILIIIDDMEKHMPLDGLLYKDVAIHEKTRQQAIFTHDGKIVVRPFDNLSAGQDRLPTLTNIDPHDFANACIIYRVASSMGVLPGLMAEGDKALIRECIELIQDDEIDKEALVEEWIVSWNKIAKDAYVKESYQAMFRPIQSSLIMTGGRKFTFFGAFSTFAEDHFYHILHYAFFKKEQNFIMRLVAPSQPLTPLWFFVQWVELYLSNRDIRGFQPGYFQRFFQLYTHLNECKERYPERSEDIDVAKTYLNTLTGGWYHHLVDEIDRELASYYSNAQEDAKFLQSIQNNEILSLSIRASGVIEPHRASQDDNPQPMETLTFWDHHTMDPTPPNTPEPEKVEEAEMAVMDEEHQSEGPSGVTDKALTNRQERALAARKRAMDMMRAQMEAAVSKLAELSISEKDYYKGGVLQALVNLLNGRRPISASPDLNEDLNELVELYDSFAASSFTATNPRIDAILSRISPDYISPTNKIMFRALKDCLLTFIVSHLNHDPKPRALPLYRLAGTDTESELLNAVLQGPGAFHPFELLSIYLRTNDMTLKDVIHDIGQKGSFATLCEVLRVRHYFHTHPGNPLQGALTAVTLMTQSRNRQLCLAYKAMIGRNSSVGYEPVSSLTFSRSTPFPS